MSHLKTLLSLLACLQFADAFYPWIPAYRCILDHTCIETPGSEGKVQRGASLKLIQRLPENGIHAEQVNALASRLKRKYSNAQRNSHATTATVKAEIEKRANTYSIVTAAEPTQTNSAGIDQDGTDYSYFAEVLLGTDSKPLYMLLDTGAGQSWIMGPDCTSQACSLHNSFGAGDSTTFEAIPDSSFSIGYGSGSVSGIYANDSLNLAGLNVPLTIGIANVTSPDFSSFPMDGILGLSQRTSIYPNFIQALVGSKGLQSNLFGVSINRASDGKNNGEINFGAPDTSRFTGSLDYVSVDTSATGDWAIAMDGVSVQGTDVGITGKLAYIDTGTSYIFAPPADVTKFMSIVPGSQSSDGSTWTVPCTTTTPLTFIFGGTTYSVPSIDWVGPKVNGACTSNVFGQEVVPGQWLLGDTFLKSVYAVFDIDGNRVGFGANSAQPTAVATTEVSSTGGVSSATNPPSTADSPTTETTTSVTQNSNPDGTETSTGTFTPQTDIPSTTTSSGETTSPETGTPGLNGHQSSDPSGTATTPAQSQDTTDPTASPTATKHSSSSHLEFSISLMLLSTLAHGIFI